MKPPKYWIFLALATIAGSFVLVTPGISEPKHGIAMHGTLKHGPDFSHFSYVNPDAPKGGEVVLGVQGGFDSVNPLIVQGVAAAGIREYAVESLMARALDEPFSLYGLIAETIETAEDRSWVEFSIRKEAKFSDGKPVTVDDVIFSYELLREKGRPNHRSYYGKVSKVEKRGQRAVRFTFDADGDQEMPLILGLMPVLPRHAIDRDNFDKSTLKPLVASGPYVVESVDPGKSITYKRNPDYWGRDLAANKGRYNFDTIRFDYYRDNNTMFEAFKRGLYHFRNERDSGEWAKGYKFPAVSDGRVKLKQFDIKVPSGMAALVFNTRRPAFQDIRVREALTLMFDFEWANKNLFHGLYKRTQSFFERSELSFSGKVADPFERKLLEPFPDAVAADVLEGTYTLPVYDGSGRLRKARREALRLLKSAGYVLKNGMLVDGKTGSPFTFEILYPTRSQERLLLSFARALKLIGIEVQLRQVDSAQYQTRKKSYDFDMLQNTWYASLSPGNEQNFRWSTQAADTEGTFNFPGIKNRAVDAMIAAMLSAKDRGEFVSSVRALDRVLVSGRYVIPLFHLPKQLTAHWKQLKYPEATSLYGFRLETWWVDESQ